MNVWTEHRNPEGRTYWFNTSSKESVWEKPDDLKSPFEKALNQTKWKEYFSGGRKYYYNTDTKESKWDMPEELTTLMKQVEEETKTNPPASAGPTITNGAASMQGALVPMGSSDTSSSFTGLQPVPLDGVTGALGAHTGALPLVQGALPARPNLPNDPVIPHNGFTTIEEGEKAFIHLLRKAGVDANWTWDQTMRSIITDPLYKALNTLAEKKAAWQKHTDALKAKEAEERDARLSKSRPAIRNMLRGNPNVFPYTTYATANKLFASHPIWQTARMETERKLIFEEHVNELREREVQEQRVAHNRAITKVVNMFKDLQIDVITKWRDAQRKLVDSNEWQSDPDLRQLASLDLLLAFEDYSRVQEREFEEQTRRQQVEKTRKERKAREAFRGLLQELIESGHLKARTKWKQIYSTFCEDERYLNMLGLPGSNPLELFWDVVDELDQSLDSKLHVVESAVQAHRARSGQEFIVRPETTFEEFEAIIKDDAEVKRLSQKDLNEILRVMQADISKRIEDDKRRTERKQRHLQDDLRYALKKLPDGIDLNISYEDAVPMMEALPEFQALEDEGRRAAFVKYIKRQKERLRDVSDDGGSNSGRRRKEPARDYDRDRDGRGSKHHGRDYRDRDRDYSRDRDYRDKDRDNYGHRSAPKYHRDYDDRRRGSRSDFARDADGSPDAREKRSLPPDDRGDDRAEKRARYESEQPSERAVKSTAREDTPEEGEI